MQRYRTLLVPKVWYPGCADSAYSACSALLFIPTPARRASDLSGWLTRTMRSARTLRDITTTPVANDLRHPCFKGNSVKRGVSGSNEFVQSEVLLLTETLTKDFKQPLSPRQRFPLCRQRIKTAHHTLQHRYPASFSLTLLAGTTPPEPLQVAALMQGRCMSHHAQKEGRKGKQAKTCSQVC